MHRGAKPNLRSCGSAGAAREGVLAARTAAVVDAPARLLVALGQVRQAVGVPQRLPRARKAEGDRKGGAVSELKAGGGAGFSLGAGLSEEIGIGAELSGPNKSRRGSRPDSPNLSHAS